jgi:tRNA/rRNA methyltransferase
MDALPALDRLRIVLSRTSHPGNIGAAARALKTMGLAQLFLVQPRHFPHEDATALAAGAADILEQARVCASLEEALADTVFVAGFSARRRDLSHRALELREAAPELLDHAARGPVALVFGNETSGLSNDELGRCQVLVAIPANPAYGSLNLAAAVQLAAYEVSLAAGAHRVPLPRERALATAASVEALFAEIEAAAVSSGFLDPEEPGRMMERLRRLFARAGLEREEVNLLLGLFAALRSRGGKP